MLEGRGKERTMREEKKKGRMGERRKNQRENGRMAMRKKGGIMREK